MGIIKDRHGTYYVQRKVPERLQEVVARVLNADEPRRVFLKKSLGTKNFKEAKAAAPHVVADFNRIIGEAEALLKQQPVVTTLTDTQIKRMAASFGSTTLLRKWPSDLLRDYEEEHKRPLDRKRYTVAKLREKIIAHHPILDRWGKPRDGRVRTWADLMFDESRVIVDTMLWLMRSKDVPSLAVHDSLIVPQEHEELTDLPPKKWTGLSCF